MDTRTIEAELAQQYKYKPLPKELSEKYRALYAANVPDFLTRHQSLYTINKTLICNDFNRIVIGDYGAFVEFLSEQANKDVFTIAPGQEYRLLQQYNNAKYIWLTILDDSNIKIYYQRNTVKYADYIPKRYYVSVHEVII